jgi:hypothetical protein
MHPSWFTTIIVLLIFWLGTFNVLITHAQLHPSSPAQYQTLPSLREQATILDQWRDERVSRIPDILAERNADAWLVSVIIGL